MVHLRIASTTLQRLLDFAEEPGRVGGVEGLKICGPTKRWSVIIETQKNKERKSTLQRTWLMEKNNSTSSQQVDFLRKVRPWWLLFVEVPLILTSSQVFPCHFKCCCNMSKGHINFSIVNFGQWNFSIHLFRENHQSWTSSPSTNQALGQPSLHRVRWEVEPRAAPVQQKTLRTGGSNVTSYVIWTWVSLEQKM